MASFTPQGRQYEDQTPFALGVLQKLYLPDEILTRKFAVDAADCLKSRSAFFFPRYSRTLVPHRIASTSQIISALMEGAFCSAAYLVEENRGTEYAGVTDVQSYGEKMHDMIMRRMKLVFRQPVPEDSEACLDMHVEKVREVQRGKVWYIVFQTRGFVDATFGCMFDPEHNLLHLEEKVAE